MAIVWLRNSQDVSESTIRAPDGYGRPRKSCGSKAAGNKNPRPLGRTNRIFPYLWGRNDPFISRKVLQSHMQFGFGTSAFFSYLCPAIRSSGLSWLNGKIWKIYLSSQVHILLCGAACAVWHGIWFPTSLRRGLYALTATKVFQSRPLGKQTVVRVRILCYGRGTGVFQNPLHHEA